MLSLNEAVDWGTPPALVFLPWSKACSGELNLPIIWLEISRMVSSLGCGATGVGFEL